MLIYLTLNINNYYMHNERAVAAIGSYANFLK